MSVKKPVASVAVIDQFDALGETLPKSIATIIERRKKALTAADLSELLPIKEDTFLQWAREGRIPSMKLNGCVVFDPRATAQWLREHMRGVKAR